MRTNRVLGFTLFIGGSIGMGLTFAYCGSFAVLTDPIMMGKGLLGATSFGLLMLFGLMKGGVIITGKGLFSTSSQGLESGE